MVIGGGQVAQRKAEALLQAEARVIVIGPKLCPGINRMAKAGSIQAEARPYHAGDLEGAWLAIAATDDPGVNSSIAAEAEDRGILVNVVDDPSRCSFIAPSIIRRGSLVVAISTGGKSPALARKVRETLESILPEEYDELTDLLAEARQEAKRQGKVIPPEQWQRSITPEVMGLLAEGSESKARDALMSNLGLKL